MTERYRGFVAAGEVEVAFEAMPQQEQAPSLADECGVFSRRTFMLFAEHVSGRIWLCMRDYCFGVIFFSRRYPIVPF
jgi:hypothetical protein